MLIFLTKSGMDRQLGETTRLPEKLLSIAIEQSANTILISDPNGTIEFVNLRLVQLTGYRSEELMGQNPRIFRSGLTAEDTYREMWSTLNQARQWTGELLNRKKDGSYYWAHLTISPVLGEDGALTHFLAIGEDITQQKLIEQAHAEKAEKLGLANARLRELDDEKNRFLGIAAHDLRSPLSKIKTAIDMVLDGKAFAEQDRQLLQMIERTATGMLSLLGDLLDVTKIEVGKVEIKIQPVDVSELLTSLVQSESFIFERKSIAFTTKCDPSITTALLDEKRIKQVLVNFLTNAAKFSSPSTSVTLEAIRRADSIVLEVTDQGPGISPEDQPLLFQAFSRTRNIPTANELSSGLGLSICRKLASLHGGTVGVRSEVGKGSTFYCEIPGALKISDT